MLCNHPHRYLDFTSGCWVCKDCLRVIPVGCTHPVTNYRAGCVYCLECGELVESEKCHKKCPVCLADSTWFSENRAKCNECDKVFQVVNSQVCPECGKNDRIISQYTVSLKDGVKIHFHCYGCKKDFDVTKSNPPKALTSNVKVEKPTLGPSGIREYVSCPLCKGQVPFYNTSERGYCIPCKVSVIRGNDGRLSAISGSSHSSRSSYTSYTSERKWTLHGPCPKCGKELTVYSGKGAWCSTCQGYQYPVVKADPYVLELDL